MCSSDLVMERRSSWVRALRPSAHRLAINMVRAVPSRVLPIKDGARRKNARLKWQPRPLPISHCPAWLLPSGRPICKSHTILTLALTSSGPNNHGLGWRKRCQIQASNAPAGNSTASQ